MLAPYRTLSDIKSDGELWHDAWRRFEARASLTILAVRDHIDDFHQSKKQARQEAAARQEALTAGGAAAAAAVDDVVAAALDADDPDNADLFDANDGDDDVDDAAVVNAALAALESEQSAALQESAAFANAALHGVNNNRNRSAVPSRALDALTTLAVEHCASIDIAALVDIKSHQKTAIDNAVAAARLGRQVRAVCLNMCMCMYV